MPILDLLITWFSRQMETTQNNPPVEIIDRGVKIAALEEKRQLVEEIDDSDTDFPQ